MRTTTSRLSYTYSLSLPFSRCILYTIVLIHLSLTSIEFSSSVFFESLVVLTTASVSVVRSVYYTPINIIRQFFIHTQVFVGSLPFSIRIRNVPSKSGGIKTPKISKWVHRAYKHTYCKATSEIWTLHKRAKKYVRIFCFGFFFLLQVKIFAYVGFILCCICQRASALMKNVAFISDVVVAVVFRMLLWL